MIIKKLLSNKLLTVIIFLNFLLIVYISNKFLKSDNFYSGFYFNFLIYLLLFFIINIIIQVQKFLIIKTYYVIVLFSLIFGFYSLEIYLVNYNNKLNTIEDLQFRKQQALKIGKEFDTRTKFEVFSTLEKNGVKVTPTIPPNNIFTKKKIQKLNHQIFAFSNISNVYNVFCNESGKRIVYLSDRYGFRNDDKIWDQDVDIVISGDSIVQGACVENKDVTADVLANLSNKKVLNLGIQGYGPLMQLATLKEYAIYKKPKIVLWYYFEANDLPNMIDELKNEKLIKYKNENFNQGLIFKQDKINIQLQEVIKIFRKGINNKNLINQNDNKLNIINILKLRNSRNLLNSYLPNSRSLLRYRYYPNNLINDYFDILLQAEKLVKSWGGELYFVYHPDLARYLGFNSSKYRERQYGLFLKRLKKNEIKIIDFKSDLYDKLDNVKDIYHFGLHGHPNELGYKLSAEVINKNLKNN